MSEIVFLVEEEAAEGDFSARALAESIFTQAETLEALREQVRDAAAVTRLGDGIEQCPRFRG